MVRFREGRVSDFHSIANLMRQLGYPCDPKVMEGRLQAMNPSENPLFVAEVSGKVIGLIHLEVRTTLMYEPIVEVVSFVIDEACRGARIGRQLFTVAENWVVKNGYRRIQLYSCAKNTDAHHFCSSHGLMKESETVMFAETI